MKRDKIYTSKNKLGKIYTTHSFIFQDFKFQKNLFFCYWVRSALYIHSDFNISNFKFQNSRNNFWCSV